MTSTPRTLIRLDRVTCAFDHAPVLVDVDLDLCSTTFMGIAGPSGSGKSTLLRAVLGMVPPVAGTVQRRPDVRVGYVPQVETVNWSFPVTVAQCVLMARTRGRLLPWASRAERSAVNDTLDRLGIAALADRHIRDLSGGQQQRVFIARALLGQPDLLLMDEPTSGVDVHTRHEILHLLKDLHRDGLAIVLTTHDLNGIAAHLPHLVCLNTRITGEGSPRDVLTPEVLERTYGGAHGDPRARRDADRPRHGRAAQQRHRHLTTRSLTVQELLRPFAFEFFRDGLIVATFAGALCGLVGVYVVLKGMSYIGHGLSHAIFGGFAASALLGVNFLLGAGAWGIASALMINGVTRRRVIGADAAIGVITTASFALGLALFALFGRRGQSFDAVLMVVLAASILATMQVLGVTLIAAALVIPATVPRMLTNSFSRMLWLATAIGAVTGFVGMNLSYHLDTQSGPTIVLVGATLFALGFFGSGVRACRRLHHLDPRGALTTVEGPRVAD